MEPIIFVIEKAQLTNIKKHNQKKHTENHIEKRFKKKHPQVERSDITHQCLLTLLDSPLNKAGKLRIYIHTTDNVLIEVNPSIRIPRTTSRFNCLVAQLLGKLKIRAVSGETLLRVIKNPITLHLPPNTVRVELCKDGMKMEKNELKTKLERGYTFFVNAIASGEDGNCEFAECKMKVSDYGISAALCCGKVCNLFEEIYNIF